MGYLQPREMWGWSMFFLILFTNMSSNHSILSALFMFGWGQFKLYWNRDSAFMLMAYDFNFCCVSTYQQWLPPCLVSCFDNICANLEYRHLRISQRSWTVVIDRIMPWWLWWSHPYLFGLYGYRCFCPYHGGNHWDWRSHKIFLAIYIVKVQSLGF